MKHKKRRVLLVLAVVAIGAAIALGLRPMPVEADLATIDRGTVRESVDQDGKTRIRERYVVSAPLAGQLLRIDLEPGDETVAGKTILAFIEPRDPDLLDRRAVLQAEANVHAAEAKLRRMKPVLEEALAAQEYAETELHRAEDLREANPRAVSQSEIDSRQMTFRMRSAAVRAAQHAEDIAQFELDQARAALVRSRPSLPEEGDGDSPRYRPAIDEPFTGDDDWHFKIRSPITGRVLRVFQESSSVVAPGDELLELGDPTDLEVVIDVLSRDAVRIKPGAAVLLEHWGGEKPLHGSVRLVEPSGFTKISTLGVEEQRVNVVVDLLDPPTERASLGDGFRVEARIIVAESKNALRVPTSAQFRVGDQWAVFKIADGVARLQTVKLGLQNGLQAEVLEGLAEGDVVVTHPGDSIVEGVQVIPRQTQNGLAVDAQAAAEEEVSHKEAPTK